MHGRATGSTITQCGREGTIDGIFKVGGIVGKADKSTISSCYNKANVTAYFAQDITGKKSSAVGGIVGTTAALRWSNHY